MHKGFWLGLIVGIAVYMPMANAANYLSEFEFYQSGAWATTLENALDAFLMPIEVQLIGNAVYNDPAVFGNNIPPISPSSSPQIDFVTAHQGSFCSQMVPTENTLGCKGQAGNLGGDKTTAQMYEMGDIRPSMLLEPLMYNQALTYGAINIVRNLTMPFPSATFHNFVTNQSSFSGNASQQRAYANYMSSQGFLSVARYALDEMFGMRIPGSYLTLGSDAPSGVNTQSIMLVMENEASRRFGDTNYAGNANAFLQSATEPQILADIAAMQAFQLWMDYQAYRQNERIAALLAAMLANNISGAIQGTISSINAGAPPQ